MKSVPDTSKLDAYIRETLKSSNETFTPFDWSEVEVLLKPQPRSLPLEISKKNMLMAAAGAGILIVLFGIFKIAAYYSALPDEPENETGESKNVLTPVDSIIQPNDSAPLKTDTAKVDSTAWYAAARRKADSLAAVARADSMTKTKRGIEPLVKPIKNKKTDTLQKPLEADTISPEIPVDTVSVPVPKKEPVIDTPATPDTTQISAPVVPPGKKKKPKKTVPPPAGPQPGVPAAQPDSLKQ